jgi:hypothetical protein
MKSRNKRNNLFGPIVFLALAVLLGVLSAAGCRKSEGEPKDVVVKFFEHIYDGDYGSAMPYCTDRCLRQVLDDGTLAFNKVRQDFSSGGNIYTESKLVSHLKGTNTCEIYSEENEDLRIWLIKQDGKWMIDEFEYRRPERDRDRDADQGDEDQGDEDDRRRARD